MKYFRPKSALVYGSEIAVWATFWATYDAARLVGLRPVVRQIAARGRLCAGAACPVGGGSPLWRRDVPASCGLDADACRVRRGDGCRSDARCRVACRRRRGCCPLLSSSVMTRCARRACDVCIARPEADIRAGLHHVCFVPKTRREQVHKWDHYSMVSWARTSTAGGTSRPSTLAVLRLITGSYLVSACTVGLRLLALEDANRRSLAARTGLGSGGESGY